MPPQYFSFNLFCHFPRMGKIFGIMLGPTASPVTTVIHFQDQRGKNCSDLIRIMTVMIPSFVPTSLDLSADMTESPEFETRVLHYFQFPLLPPTRSPRCRLFG